MPVMTTFKDGEIAEQPFETAALQVLHALRTSIRAVIGNLPQTAVPGGIKRARDVQQILKIDSKLAWQLYKLAFAAGPLAEGVNLPKTSSMKRFLRAAEERGVPGNLIDRAREALNDLDQLIIVHAGDFGAFESMLSGLSEADSEPIDHFHKRAAFKAQSHLWGVQAKTQLTCFLYNAAANNPAELDVAVIRGLLNLRRFRRDTSWTIARLGVSDDDGEQRRDLLPEPLDPASQTEDGVALMREFCTQPLPEIQRMPAAMGMTNLELIGDSVGNQSSVTYIVGDVSRNAMSRYQDEHNHIQMSQTLVRTPCEVLVHDVLVPEGLFGEIDPVSRVYGDQRAGDAPALGRDCDLLAVRERIDYLGRGPEAMHTPDVPRYAEIVHSAFDRLGWDRNRFDVYRCRVEYPIMPSSVVVQHDLPELPDAIPPA